MSLQALFLLAGALFVLAITPGPGVMLIVARTMTAGLKHGLVAVAGIVTADLIFLLLVVYGLQVIAESVGFLFTTIKYIGGLYLIWLGISLWRSKPKSLSIPSAPSKRVSYKASWISGLIITLSNPKAILFYMSFLPAFVDIPSLTTADIILVSFIVCTVIGSVMFFYAFSTWKTQHIIKNKASGNLTKKIAGGLMVTTGGILITKT
ncbi:MAG: LysE family translocator [Cellvibrionaceae bacterium]